MTTIVIDVVPDVTLRHHREGSEELLSDAADGEIPRPKAVDRQNEARRSAWGYYHLRSPCARVGPT